MPLLRPIKKWRRRRRAAREHAAARVIVVSFPKSGRTWLRMLVGKALTEQFGVAESEMLDAFALSRATGCLPTLYTHDDTPNTEARPWTRLESDKSRYRGKKVIFLCRDPRDVVVSCYFQASRRHDVFRGELADFIRDDRFGLRKILRFYEIWERSRGVPDEFLLLHYEEMHANPLACLRRVLEFIGVTDIDPAAAARAVDFARFDHMRELEATHHFPDKGLRPRIPGDDESFKVRRGKIGGYVDYLSADDQAWAEALLREHPSAFLTERSLRAAKD